MVAAGVASGASGQRLAFDPLLDRAKDAGAITIQHLDPDQVDMRTLLIVGSSQTRAVRRGDGERIVWTPRRYPEK